MVKVGKKIKILHLEDEPLEAALIARELKKGKINAEIFVVSNKVDFKKVLRNFKHDIILSDHSLASFNSHEAIQLVKEAGITVPFILVTATMTDEFAVRAMKQGAHDYILKDRLERLPEAVRKSIENQRLKEEKLAAHERLLFHIENAPLGFIEWDNQGFAKSCSKRVEQIFGWSAKEFVKNKKNRFCEVYKDDYAWVSKIFEQLINGEIERTEVQCRNITKGGDVIWCHWFNSVLKSKDNKVRTIMSLVQDITEQKEKEVRKDNFLSIASHELKTPLTTIKAYGQMAESTLKEIGDVTTLHLIESMNSQLNKLTTLTENLLDFTKIQEGKLVYNEAFFDFNELIKEVISDMQKISQTHEIKNNSGKTATIFGDKDKLTQVLSNLISNAIKYSPKAHSIVINTRLQKEGIRVSVGDFGIGISAEELKSVFDQFYRVQKDQSTYPGMGIGLYICSEIITRHCGKIWVESSINKGSTFHALLPYDHRNKIGDVVGLERMPGRKALTIRSFKDYKIPATKRTRPFKIV